jgi:hypothetical protein
MKCADIDVKLSGDKQSGYFVEVISSPLASRSEPQSLALPRCVEDGIKTLRGRQTNRSDCKRLGKDLFEALFPPANREFWHQSKGRAGDAGVLRLRLDIRANELMNIPWEIIHDGEEYLALSARSPVVRYLHGNASLRPFEINGPLDVLLVTSTPHDLTQLPGVKTELEMIRRSLKTPGSKIKVRRCETLAHATSQTLHASMESCHVMHYMGHGAFIRNRGYLFLEDSGGNSDWEEAETIGDFLRDKPLRLLLLNACDTAIPSSEESLIGVAHAAHAAGVPAVIAMQQTILDSAATAFAGDFYQALTQAKPLEACLAAGRLAIKNRLGPESAEWAIPVMFSNAPAGALCVLLTALEEPGARGGIINAPGAAGPIVQGPVSGDVIGTNISVGRSWRENFDLED